jgi:hypothetical protein
MFVLDLPWYDLFECMTWVFIFVGVVQFGDGDNF